MERPISKQALSKYEQGQAQPTPSRIADLAQALNVSAASLLAEDALEIEWVAYRKNAKLSKARRNQLTARAQRTLEVEFRLRRLFRLSGWNESDLPGPINVRNFNDCEYAAAALRMRWGLGERPIDGLVELIEERGGFLVGWEQAWGFDALSGWADRSPVLVLNTAVPADRVRFNVAHEIGHLVMSSTHDDREDERFAMRFAAAFLVPAEAARSELGSRRRRLEIAELGLLKQRWGLSMQGWIRRARDLEIITADRYRSLNIAFRSQGWHRVEPYAYESNEQPTRLRRLALRALAEQMITSEEAERFAPELAHQLGTTRERQRRLRDLALQPLGKRRRVLREVAISVDRSETEAWDRLPSDDVE